MSSKFPSGSISRQLRSVKKKKEKNKHIIRTNVRRGIAYSGILFPSPRSSLIELWRAVTIVGYETRDREKIRPSWNSINATRRQTEYGNFRELTTGHESHWVVVDKRKGIKRWSLESDEYAVRRAERLIRYCVGELLEYKRWLRLRSLRISAKAHRALGIKNAAINASHLGASRNSSKICTTKGKHRKLDWNCFCGRKWIGDVAEDGRTSRVLVSC